MYAQIEKSKEYNRRAVANSSPPKKSNDKQDYWSVANRSEVVTQRTLKVAGQEIKDADIEAAMLSAAKKQLLPKVFYNRSNRTNIYTINEKGKSAKQKLLDKYRKSELRLRSKDSLVYQVSQDMYLIEGSENSNEDQLIAIPHQHYEYTKGNDNKPTAKGLGHWNNDMRIYRNLPKFAWDQAKLVGHGGSLGQALHYFRRDQKETDKNQNRVSYIVEFTIPRKLTKDMIRDIKGGSEGELTNESKFGGKSEQNTAFGETSGLFSVDMGNSGELLKNNGAVSRVVASTGAYVPTEKKHGREWTKGLAIKPEDW
ncbi:hypothetical protein OA92_04285 [Marinomonas sp. SBI22]|uniref:hypothetical protein n=1 Tax=unclassified Marinomonas TaxID=196814 RepID=UPI0007AF9CF6|nr:MULTISPECIES: hypothetical protein [unclassified Marinomonas]KZM45077.1 hypothetical protein OA92_04285 [Marinomonas sp. SBI22]KZM46775.1 hypothetical protein OA91_03340 [Marinomonas sp. SBI8L]